MGNFNAIEESIDRRGNTAQAPSNIADNLAVRLLKLTDDVKRLKPRQSGFTQERKN